MENKFVYVLELKDHSKVAVATKYDLSALNGIIASARRNKNTIGMHLLSDHELAQLPNNIKQNIANWHASFISVPAKNIHRFDRI